MIKSTLLAAALALGTVSSASALTVTAFQEGQTSNSVTLSYGTAGAFALANYAGGPYTLDTEESFEGFAVGTQDLSSTAVGSFEATPPIGNGTSVVGDPTKLMVKSSSMTKTQLGGRKPVDGTNFLDSNDNNGLKWKASVVGRSITSLAFFLTDANDQGRIITLKVGDGPAEEILPPELLNSNLAFITIFLDAPAKVVEIAFSNSRNDGFGIDGVQVSAVPLPPTALLLGSAFVGAAFLRRRKAQRA
jgi:hypothetical protein